MRISEFLLNSNLHSYYLFQTNRLSSSSNRRSSHNNNNCHPSNRNRIRKYSTSNSSTYSNNHRR